MINWTIYLLAITALYFLTSCSILPDSAMKIINNRRMGSVIKECEKLATFNKLALCVKDTYSKEGSDPNALPVRVFYSLIDEINEEFKMGKISEIQARASIYRALVNTIEEENKHKARADSLL